MIGHHLSISAWMKRVTSVGVMVLDSAPDKPLTIDPKLLISTQLRGIPTQGWLDRDKALDWAVVAPWTQACLTWDEMNANTEQNVELRQLNADLEAREPHERVLLEPGEAIRPALRFGLRQLAAPRAEPPQHVAGRGPPLL